MTKPNERHVPVLFDEVMDFLRVRRGGTYVDCTLGLAGHAEGIVRQLGSAGHLIGFDRDPEALDLAKARLASVCQELGSQAPQVTFDRRGLQRHRRARCSRPRLTACLATSAQAVCSSTRRAEGLVFRRTGHWICVSIRANEPTAEQVVNETSERELADLIYTFGEERRSRTVARAIVRGRPVTTTGQLARIVASALPRMKHAQIHPATRTFQALRIFVNQELDEIRALLEAAPKLLKPSARLVVISFHSLEDRIAKDSIREGAQQGIWKILTKKPVTAGEEEIDRNPRSRSAKLRAAERQ